MDKVINQDEWEDFFNKFNKINSSRATRLSAFDELGAQTIEHGLSLSGLDLQTKGQDSPIVEIILGREKPEQKHMTHSISNVTQVAVKFDDAGREEVLEIENEKGAKVLLSFESMAEVGGG
ncbi:MAG: hypothetical protein GWO07_06900 [Candidatus Dadabacteria bacterium]|nr:hypothetical protein [Candidatus Dadabacteria bacterium]NIS08478.1 hypothetical protein [Candidatus Dadabacteria bacterium]NIY21966.1 hypothetical protein [Candidatus Dadabacteria bacterium]